MYILKPAYCLRLKDLIPFVGLDRHEKRTFIGALTEENQTGINCGPGSDYEKRAWGREITAYNIVVVTPPVLAGIAGLVKLLC